MNADGISIYDYYKGKKVLITGGTGFVGKVLLEKVLRTLEVDKVYLLIRDSKKTAEEKFEDLINSKAFLRLKDRYQDGYEDWFRDKVKFIRSDLTKEGLDLSASDREYLEDNLDLIIHCGASVDFDANIYDNFLINVEGTLALYDLAEKSKKDVEFCYVSTAYVNSYKGSACISEFSSPRHFVNPFELVDHIREYKKDAKIDFNGHPNTYTYTKSLAETILLERSGSSSTRVAIVRPSCICSAHREPFPGWVDSISATSAVILFTAMGAARTLNGSASNIADNIPVDYVVNAILLGIFDSRGEKLRVYHSSSSFSNPMTWGDVRNFTIDILKIVPFEKGTMNPSMAFFNYDLMGRIHRNVKFKLPYRIFYVLSLVLPKKYSDKILRKLEKGDEISSRMYSLFSYFVKHQWIFKSEAIEIATGKLNKKEKDDFGVDLKDIVWDDYFVDFIRGIKGFVAEMQKKKKRRT